MKIIIVNPSYSFVSVITNCSYVSKVLLFASVSSTAKDGSIALLKAVLDVTVKILANGSFIEKVLKAIYKKALGVRNIDIFLTLRIVRPSVSKNCLTPLNNQCYLLIILWILTTFTGLIYCIIALLNITIANITIA